MTTREPLPYWIFLGLTIALSLLAVVTMLPNPSAAKPNVLGYRSVCSFAPAASALCALLAGAVCTIRNRRFSRNASSARYRPLIVPVAVAVLLVGMALGFGIRFGVVQSRFASLIGTTRTTPVATAGSWVDGTRSATVTEGEVSATVEVTVSAGAIHDLRLTAGRNIDAELARTMFMRVKNAGSTSVDAVSGATVSSNVLLGAVAAAVSVR
jgi:uncharacterized protein with FMN-binding domain